MPLRVGSRIAHFEVTGLLGEGGMGQVYRATDTKLRRDVALKILPEAFASDPERLARFEREAQALAALNHSGIAAIYGIEEFEGTLALVLELIPGPTLEERIAGRAVPVPEATRIGIAIAAAVEAAHERGIVHRDLKPSNIKIASDGTVKVLDFGLAKALSLGDGSGATLTAEATTQTARTSPGLIMGTPAYMSPEQALGEPVDERTDVWAFGCILYEMLVGRPPFGRGRTTDILAGVLKDEPDFSVLPAEVPPLTRRLLRRSLEKDRRERLRHIADARADLRDSLMMGDALGSGDTTGSSRRVATEVHRTSTRRRGRAAAALVATLIAIAAIAAVAVRLAGRRDLPDTARPEPVSFEFTDVPIGHPLAISPDAGRIVYGLGEEIFQRSLRQATRTQARWQGHAPFFSADGESVGFFREGESSTELWRVPSGGGSPTLIADLDLEGVSEGRCCAGDRVVVATAEGLYRVPMSGGAPELLLAPDPAEKLDELEILPGGRTVLFSVGPAIGRWPGDRRGGETPPRIDALELESGKRRTVLPSGHRPRYSRTGHLVYEERGRLQAVAFDPDTLKTQGDPRELVNEDIAQFDVADDGTIVYQAVTTAPTQGVWIDRNGRQSPYSAPATTCGYPSFSPDGKKVVADCFTSRDVRDIWIWDLEREVATRVTEDPAPDLFPVWSKDGSRIYFSSNRIGGAMNVYSRAADGTGSDQLLLESDAVQFPMALTPDGAQLVVAQEGGNGFDIVAIDLAPPHGARALLATKGSEIPGSLSPDGRWIVYSSDIEGQWEVYVGPYPDLESRKWKISSGGGSTPVWSPEGDEIFFRGPTGMMAALVTLTPTLTPGKVTELFPDPSREQYVGGGGRHYDVSPLNGRFLMWKEADDAPINRLVVLLDPLPQSPE